MAISFDEPTRAWHLSGPGYSYVVGRCGAGMPRQRYRFPGECSGL